MKTRGDGIKKAVGITVLLFLLLSGSASPPPVLLKINGDEQAGGYKPEWILNYYVVQ